MCIIVIGGLHDERLPLCKRRWYYAECHHCALNFLSESLPRPVVSMNPERSGNQHRQHFAVVGTDDRQNEYHGLGHGAERSYTRTKHL